MLGSYFSPLAPAAILLLGAFILSIIFPRLPAWPWLQYYGAPLLVGLAVLALLGTRLTVGQDGAGLGLELISGWNFSTAESAATLATRADVLSLSFLMLTLLVLLSATLAYPPLASPVGQDMRVEHRAGWLVMGAGAGALFVSANGLTLGYSILLFDTITALYWLRRGQPNLGVARLFLGVFTASGLALVTLNAGWGSLVLGLALWSRLGLYPFFETVPGHRRQDAGQLIYLALSLAVGLYLVIRGVVGPLPVTVRWLVIITILFNGLLTWLAGQRSSMLARLALTQALLILLSGNLVEGIAPAFATGLILSLAALWVTPRLGRPPLAERAWPWLYLPAAMATLTLIGAPFSLGWLAWSGIYQSLFLFNNDAIIALAVLAEGLALSGLAYYWRSLWQGTARDGRRSVAGIVSMVPFLIPGLGPFILGAIIRADLPAADFEMAAGVYVALAATVAIAAGLGYYRTQLLAWIAISPEALSEVFYLTWLLAWFEEVFNQTGKILLRVRVFLEGQHYMGWTLLTAVVGVLIILLGS